MATPMQLASDNLKEAFDYYFRENKGDLPSSWNKLDAFLIDLEQTKNPARKERSELFSTVDARLGNSIENSFTLVSTYSIKMVTPNKYEIFHGGTVIVVTTNPISEDRRSDVGRYVIWKDMEGRFRSSWLNETVVATQFKEAGIELPSGSLKLQPPTFDVALASEFQNYATAHFKDPKKPTAEEIEKLRNYLAEKHSDKRAETTASPIQPEPALVTVNEPKLVPPPPPAIIPKSPETTSWPLIACLALAVFATGAVAWKYLRKQP